MAENERQAHNEVRLCNVTKFIFGQKFNSLKQKPAQQTNEEQCSYFTAFAYVSLQYHSIWFLPLHLLPNNPEKGKKVRFTYIAPKDAYATSVMVSSQAGIQPRPQPKPTPTDFGLHAHITAIA